MFKLDLEKAEKNKRSSCQHPLDHRKKQENSRITSISASLTMLKSLCGSQQTGKFKRRKWPDHLICLLRNLYTGQEATVRTGHETTTCFQIGEGVCQGCTVSPCLFNLYAGIKIARRNINNLRYADDTTLMAESEEELRASWWKWKRRVKKLG